MGRPMCDNGTAAQKPMQDDTLALCGMRLYHVGVELLESREW